MNERVCREIKHGKEAVPLRYKLMLAVLSVLFLLNGCMQEGTEHEAGRPKPQATAAAAGTPGDHGPVPAVQFGKIVQIPSEIYMSFATEMPVKSDHISIKSIARKSNVYDVRFKPPYLIYSHSGDENDMLTILDTQSMRKTESISRTSLRRFIRDAELSDTGYSYMTTAEHEPHIWQYRQFDHLHSEILTKTIDIKEIISNGIMGEQTYGSDVEEERNLLAWIEETEGGGKGVRNLYICRMDGNVPALVHTIRLNKGVNTLTPLTIENEVVSYADWSPETEKWYIRAYDVFKGEHSPYSCDFELDAMPESPPIYDRSAVSWIEEADGGNFLYCYVPHENKKILVDTDVQSPRLRYPWLTYVKDGKLFGFNYHEMKKCVLYENPKETVVSGDMNYCLTRGEEDTGIYLVSLLPEPRPEPVMKYVVNDRGIRELERVNLFERTGMSYCKVTYNGVARPELYINMLGWYMPEVCAVIGADLKIHSTKNVLGEDVPEKFVVVHGDTVLTFTGEPTLDATGDGAASYTCAELPALEAVFIKRHIEVDLPDFLDALHIPWTADTTENVFHIEGK